MLLDVHFEDFTWGLITGLFVSILLLFGVFGITVLLGFRATGVLMMTIIGFNFAVVLFGISFGIYYLAIVKGKINKGRRLKDLLIELQSIKNAKKQIEEGYFKRTLDKDSRDKILRDLKKNGTKLKNQIELLKMDKKTDEE